MSETAGRLARLREKSQEWAKRAVSAASSALTWIGTIIAIAVAITIGWALVSILGRAGDEISSTLMSGAPMLGRVLGYLLVAALLAGGVALFFVALAAVVRLGAWGLSAIAARTANKTSPQAERYVVAGLLALLPAAGAYLVATQGTFQALPLELKQHLVPVLLPFAIGAVAAPLGSRGQALTLTLLALVTMTGIVVAIGYLSPTPSPLGAMWRWADLMRQGSAIQQLWWMLLVVLGVAIWAIAVFAGSKEGDVDDRPRSSARFDNSMPASSAA